MKILFLTDNYPPEINAPANRTHEHAKAWVKNPNVEVTIITSFPNHPYGKIYDGYKNKIFSKEKIDGINVIRVWTYMSSNSGVFRRIFDYLSFAFMSFCIGLFQKSDIIIATSPQFFTTWSACLLSKIKRVPWIFELRDLWPESIKSVGAITNKSIIKFLEIIELSLYKSASKIIVVTESFKSDLISRNIDSKKIHVVYNGVNSKLFKPMKKSDELLEKYSLKNKIVIGYVGTHGMAHNLDFIINSAKKINRKDIHFLFVGDGAMKSHLVALAKKHKLQNVTFEKSVQRNEVDKYLALSDISLINLKKDKAFKKVIPSKIFEASAMKIPVLLGVEGEAKKLVEKYHSGLCFKPNDEVDFINKLYILIENKTYTTFKNKALLLSQKFNRDILSDKMLSIIKSEILK